MQIEKISRKGRPSKEKLKDYDIGNENFDDQISEEDCEPIEGVLFYFRNLTGEIKQ